MHAISLHDSRLLESADAVTRLRLVSLLFFNSILLLITLPRTLIITDINEPRTREVLSEILLSTADLKRSIGDDNEIAMSLPTTARDWKNNGVER